MSVAVREDKHVDIDSVIVNGRHRQDLGDLESLKRSIAEIDLLHPVVITSDRKLIAGHRRLEALRQLGWRSVPVRVMDNLTDAHALLEAERDENTCRLDMKPSEKVALGQALEALERPHANARRGTRTDLQPAENFSGGRTSDIVGNAVGMSRPTYLRAKAVVKAADAGDPTAVEAVKDMDRTGKVTPAYEKVTGQPTTHPQPQRNIQIDTARQRNVAEARKGRLAKGIYGLEGTCAGFGEVDLRYVLPVTSEEELAEWDRLLGEAIKSLTSLRKKLKSERGVA